MTSDQSISKYNTWTTRTWLKGLSGILFVLVLWGSIYTLVGAIIVFSIFYKLEMEYRNALGDTPRII